MSRINLSTVTDKFVAGDLFGIALHFSAANVVQPKPQFVKPFRGRGFRRGRPWGGRV